MPYKKLFLTIFLFLSVTVSSPVARAQMPSLPQEAAQQLQEQAAKDERSFLQAFMDDQSLIRKKILETVFAICFGYILLFLLIRIINSSVRDIKTRHIIRKNLSYFIGFSLLIITFFIWIQKISSITIFLGVASAGLALALQEAVLCIAGWLLILVRNPFEVGDRIEINGIKGDVIDIRPFQTSLMEIGNWVHSDQSTGRIVNFPNSFLFKSENYNYSRGFEFIWNEIPVLITFESDWQKAKEILSRIADEMDQGREDDAVRRKLEIMRERYMIYYGKLTSIVYTDIKDSGVELTIRYLTEAKKRRSTQDYLSRRILEEFAKEPNVVFAYPTYRIVKE